MNGTVVPNWAKYYSWYIKEPTTEYYTLAMDRWYHAADGNIWLSFPSSERNKLDEETFLILKKAHGLDAVVTDKARYKILAIKNEAPDFIKTENKWLGTMLNAPSGGLIAMKIGANGVDGYPHPHVTFITVDKGAFEGVFGEDFIIKTPDSLWMKFYGDGKESKQYEVTKTTYDGSVTGSEYTLKIKGRSRNS